MGRSATNHEGNVVEFHIVWRVVTVMDASAQVSTCCNDPSLPSIGWTADMSGMCGVFSYIGWTADMSGMCGVFSYIGWTADMSGMCGVFSYTMSSLS